MDKDRLARVVMLLESADQIPSAVGRELVAELKALDGVTQIKERNSQLVRQVEDLTVEAARLRTQVAELQLAWDGAQPSLAQASQQLIEYRTKLALAEAERDSLRGALQPMRDTNRMMTERHHAVATELAQQQEKHEALRGVNKDLRASHEALTLERNHWRELANQHGQDLERALVREAAYKADAERLAKHVITHPTEPEAERTEVLNLHDRTLA